MRGVGDESPPAKEMFARRRRSPPRNRHGSDGSLTPFTRTACRCPPPLPSDRAETTRLLVKVSRDSMADRHQRCRGRHPAPVPLRISRRKPFNRAATPSIGLGETEGRALCFQLQPNRPAGLMYEQPCAAAVTVMPIRASRTSNRSTSSQRHRRSRARLRCSHRGGCLDRAGPERANRPSTRRTPRNPTDSTQTEPHPCRD